jgi:hypothetical protein
MTVDRATELWDETKFASIPMTHGSKETYAAPMVTNWWAEVQAAADPIAYRIFSAHPLATAEGLQAEMYMRLPHLDRVLPLHQLGEPITYVWYPDRVVRTMRYEGLKFTSVMTLAAGRNALLIEFNVANVGATSCSGLKLFLKLLSGVQQLESSSSWNTVALPSAATRADTGRNAFVFVGVGPACSVQGTDQPSLSYRSSVAYAEWLGDANLGGIVADRVRTPSVVAGFEYRVDLPPNSTWRLRYVNALANDVEPALALYDDSQAHFEERVAEARAAWESEIVAAFTPGNHRFSGNLPTLAGVDHSVQRVYRTAALTLLFMKRTGPGSRFGTVYKSISPRSGSTFWLWETQQAAGGLARLDPAALQTMAEWWMQTDIHNCWGTDYITGDPLGPWYSVNDYALFSICYDYLRHTGDLDWLRKRVAGATVLQHLQRCAGHWRELSSGDYLADYGEANNLLECVKTYAHKVAALNAANAWMNLTLAKIEERLGDSASARQRCAEARSISEAVIRLYRSGGYFACRQPDGSEVEVQHCYDFGVVMAALFDDLGPKRRSEMISFFKRKLQTPSWMRALAADDPAAAFSRRTDHMATGAYASWPCYALMALCRCGDLESALYWIGAGNESGGIAGVAKQGPFGQGTFHGGEGSLLEGGAARKAPDSPPHYEEWIDVAGGAYINVILEGLFGVRSTLFEDVGASGSLLAHLPDARFYGLRHHDQIYDYSKGKLEKRGDR